MRTLAYVLGLLLLSACRCRPTTREPDEPLVAGLRDPFAVVAARGAVSAPDRAVAVVNEVGGVLGLGARAGDALQAHADEAWAKRLALLVDLGGDAQLEAAWSDLMEGTLAASRVSADVKQEVRQSQARVLDTKGPASLRRRRLLVEITRTLALLGE